LASAFSQSKNEPPIIGIQRKELLNQKLFCQLLFSNVIKTVFKIQLFSGCGAFFVRSIEFFFVISQLEIIDGTSQQKSKIFYIFWRVRKKICL
jgi:hypothetical protein